MNRGAIRAPVFSSGIWPAWTALVANFALLTSIVVYLLFCNLGTQLYLLSGIDLDDHLDMLRTIGNQLLKAILHQGVQGDLPGNQLLGVDLAFGNILQGDADLVHMGLGGVHLPLRL